MRTLTGHIVDVVSKRIFDGCITLNGSKIHSITPATQVEDQYIVPGLIDAHIHIESSMLIPSEFARQVVTNGTVACVSDPHEIANVCGIQGIDFMIENGRNSPLKFCFGAPSCVPATHAETAGASLHAEEVKQLLQRPEIGYLAEMMNFPGVIYKDEQVILKLKAARDLGKPIDGHAPELSGDNLRAYVEEGITTDHECMSQIEAKEKIALGMKILIREGSAAKNLNELMPLIRKYPTKIMLCSDDKHPDDLLQYGHIDHLVRRILANGYDVFDTLRACTLNPIKHYKLPVGLLQTGDPADFIVVDNLRSFNVLQTWINGTQVANKDQALFARNGKTMPINHFKASPILATDLERFALGNQMRVITVEDGQLYTKAEWIEPKTKGKLVVSDVQKDVLKLVVLNRYETAEPAVAFIKNFGLKEGAIASTVAHDSHNIVAVGTSDEALAKAINELIACKGGIVAVSNTETALLPLPVAGLMSDSDAQTVANGYQQADALAKRMGSTLTAPFMTLAFMSLLVIPELKLSDKGLFDVQKFSFTDLFVND